MDKWKTALQRGLVSRTTCSLLSTGALAPLFDRACADKPDTATTLQLATAASAVACFTDYQWRLHRGDEKRRSKPSLAVVCGASGLGLAAGAMLCRRP